MCYDIECITGYVRTCGQVTGVAGCSDLGCVMIAGAGYVRTCGQVTDVAGCYDLGCVMIAGAGVLEPVGRLQVLQGVMIQDVL